MPDYSNKEIPTLDDVIDGNQSTQADSHETIEPAKQVNLEKPDDSTSDDAGDNIDEKETNEDVADSISEPHSSVHNSASNPIYPTPATSHTSVQINYQEIYDKSQMQRTAPNLNQADEPVTTEAAPIDLNAVVESVSEQIMPELEQQLKSLIQRALAEKLPKEIIKSTNTDNPDTDSTDAETT